MTKLSGWKYTHIWKTKDFWTNNISKRRFFGKFPFQSWKSLKSPCIFQIGDQFVLDGDLNDFELGKGKLENGQRAVKLLANLFDIPQKLRSYDPVKREKLKAIISHLSNPNQSYELLYNRSQYLRSSKIQFFYAKEIPAIHAADEMLIQLKGVVLLNLDLGEFDYELIETLSACLQYNSSIQILVLTDDFTLVNTPMWKK